MPIPTPLNLPPDTDRLWVADPPAAHPVEETPQDQARPPFVRITATYAASTDTGGPQSIVVDLNIDEGGGEDEDEPDLDDDSHFLRFVTKTIAALRGSAAPRHPKYSVVDNGAGAFTIEALVAIQDRFAAAEGIRRDRDARESREARYGIRGLPPEVIDKVLTEPGGGAVDGPGSAGDDRVHANLSTCTAGLPYANGGALPPPLDEASDKCIKGGE